MNIDREGKSWFTKEAREFTISHDPGCWDDDAEKEFYDDLVLLLCEAYLYGKERALNIAYVKEKFAGSIKDALSDVGLDSKGDLD